MNRHINLPEEPDPPHQAGVPTSVRAEMSTGRLRIAAVLSHPIQHFCPLFASWAQSGAIDLRVYFASRAGVDAYFDPNFGRAISWSGLQLDRFDHRFVNGTSSPAIDPWLDAPSLGDLLSEQDPAAVITFGYSQRLQLRAQRWAIANRRALIFFSDSELRQRRPLWRRIAKQFVVRRLLSRADYFIVTGNANEAYYRHYGVDDIKFIRGSYPIDRENCERAFRTRCALRNAIRERLGIREGQVAFTTIGKLVPWKRQADLIEAISRLPHGVAVALLIGTGRMKDRWERLAREKAPGRTIFTGFVPPHELPEYLAASDVYVHCSEREPHSVAISEAVFMGLPVVASDRCGSYGTDDDVRHGINGFVYPCANVGALSSVMDRLVRNRQCLAGMGDRSREIGARQQAVTHERLPFVLAQLCSQDFLPRNR